MCHITQAFPWNGCGLQGHMFIYIHLSLDMSFMECDKRKVFKNLQDVLISYAPIDFKILGIFHAEIKAQGHCEYMYMEKIILYVFHISLIKSL